MFRFGDRLVSHQQIPPSFELSLTCCQNIPQRGDVVLALRCRVEPFLPIKLGHSARYMIVTEEIGSNTVRLRDLVQTVPCEWVDITARTGLPALCGDDECEFESYVLSTYRDGTYTASGGVLELMTHNNNNNMSFLHNLEVRGFEHNNLMPAIVDPDALCRSNCFRGIAKNENYNIAGVNFPRSISPNLNGALGDEIDENSNGHVLEKIKKRLKTETLALSEERRAIILNKPISQLMMIQMDQIICFSVEKRILCPIRDASLVLQQCMLTKLCDINRCRVLVPCLIACGFEGPGKCLFESIGEGCGDMVLSFLTGFKTLHWQKLLVECMRPNIYRCGCEEIDIYRQEKMMKFLQTQRKLDNMIGEPTSMDTNHNETKKGNVEKLRIELKYESLLWVIEKYRNALFARYTASQPNWRAEMERKNLSPVDTAKTLEEFQLLREKQFQGNLLK